MAYTTNTAVKAYANITGTGDDTLLTTLIARAQKQIDMYCGRTFEASDTIRYFNALTQTHENRRILYLDTDLAATPTTITNGDGAVIATGYTVRDKNTPPYYAIELLPSSGNVWTYTDDPEDAIAITGKWAYSASAPDDIVQACIELTVWMYRRRDTFVDFERPQMSPDGMVFVPTSMPKGVMATLNIYRRVLIQWQLPRD
jgi:hypothetical protein